MNKLSSVGLFVALVAVSESGLHAVLGDCYAGESSTSYYSKSYNGLNRPSDDMPGGAPSRSYYVETPEKIELKKALLAQIGLSVSAGDGVSPHEVQLQVNRAKAQLLAKYNLDPGKYRGLSYKATKAEINLARFRREQNMVRFAQMSSVVPASADSSDEGALSSSSTSDGERKRALQALQRPHTALGGALPRSFAACAVSTSGSIKKCCTSVDLLGLGQRLYRPMPQRDGRTGCAHHRLEQ